MSNSNQPPLQLTAVQLTSSPDPAENLATLRQLFSQLPAARPQLVVLPEACLCFGAGDQHQRALAELPGKGPMQQGLAALARDFGVWLVAGTIPLIDQPEQARFSAASLLYNPAGECLARYNKIHLFDVEVADSTRNYRESAATVAGTEVVTVVTEIGTIGMAVCYDVRFPELFRQLRFAGADIIVLPSAFTVVTGSAHWHVLTKARAIEQQCALVAAAQVGHHANGRQTYGHALVVDAWGTLQADAQQASPSFATAAFAPAQQLDIRRNMPVLTQFKTQQVVSSCSQLLIR
jgi:nitrilase